jgi:tetratricopeptide (TPR) repeat protein
MNVLWHASACAALWWVLLLVLGTGWGPLAGAAVFAVHPLTSEPVNAVSYREDLITGFAVAMAVGFAIRHLRGDGRAPLELLGACAFTFLACLSKESGLTALPIIGLWWWLAPSSEKGAGNRQAAMLGGALTLTATLFIVMRFLVFVPENPGRVAQWGGSAAMALWNFPRIALHGLQLTLLPLGLAADYEWQAIMTWIAPTLWLGWLVLGGVACGALLCRRRAVPLGLGLGWWLAALLPVSNVVPLANPVAERYHYLPLMGLMLALGWSVDRIVAHATQVGANRGVALRPLAAIGAATWVVLLGLTVNHNLVWGDAERLWTETLASQPNSTTALNNLGCIRIQQGRPEEAARLLARGMEISDGENDLLNNYGIAMATLNRWDEAQRAFEVSVARNPHDEMAQWRLALCLTESPTPDLKRAWEALMEAERLGYPVPSDFRRQLERRLQEMRS